jgi:hypothetical protein
LLLDVGKQYVLVPHRWLDAWRCYIAGQSDPPEDRLLALSSRRHDDDDDVGHGGAASRPSAPAVTGGNRPPQQQQQQHSPATAVPQPVHADFVLDCQTMCTPEEQREDEGACVSETSEAHTVTEATEVAAAGAGWVPPPFLIEALEGQPSTAHLLPHFGLEGKVERRAAAAGVRANLHAMAGSFVRSHQWLDRIACVAAVCALPGDGGVWLPKLRTHCHGRWSASLARNIHWAPLCCLSNLRGFVSRWCSL